MVVFSCSRCNEALKKKQIEKHVYRCPSQSFSCIDCQQDFSLKTVNSHIKCITENQKYGGKGFVQKAFKGESKQEAWVDLVQEAIANVADPSVKQMLEKIQSYDNIPRKEAKFINFLMNSLKLRNRSLCERCWQAISNETKKAAEKKAAEAQATVSEEKNHKNGETNGKEAAKETNENGNGKINGKKEPTEEINGNDSLESPAVSCFKWKRTIKRKLKEAGGEMKVKKLKRAVVADYEQAGGVAEEAAELFEEKLKKAHVSIEGNVAQLA